MFETAKKMFFGDIASNGLHKWFQDAMEDTVYSPDVMQVEHRQRHHVFLYNQLMTGFLDHHMIMDPTKAQRVAVGFTQDPTENYTMWIKKMGRHSFPIVMEGIRDIPRESISTSRKLHNIPSSKLDRAPLARIKGELYTMRPEVLLSLDKYFENTVQFRRRRVKILIACHHVTKREVVRIAKVCEAWMYIGCTEYWQPLLDGGFVYQPASVFKPEISKYLHQFYFFTLPLEREVAAPYIVKDNRIASTMSQVPIK